jgi:hypothetical protein
MEPPKLAKIKRHSKPSLFSHFQALPGIEVDAQEVDSCYFIKKHQSKALSHASISSRPTTTFRLGIAVKAINKNFICRSKRGTQRQKDTNWRIYGPFRPSKIWKDEKIFTTYITGPE